MFPFVTWWWLIVITNESVSPDSMCAEAAAHWEGFFCIARGVFTTRGLFTVNTFPATFTVAKMCNPADHLADNELGLPSFHEWIFSGGTFTLFESGGRFCKVGGFVPRTNISVAHWLSACLLWPESRVGWANWTSQWRNQQHRGKYKLKSSARFIDFNV